MGFAFILVGSFLEPTAGNITVVAGLITEFIGGTLLLLNRVVMKQTDQYVALLHRIMLTERAMELIDYASQFSSNTAYGPQPSLGWMSAKESVGEVFKLAGAPIEQDGKGPSKVADEVDAA